MKCVDQKPIGRMIGEIARMQANRADQLMDQIELFRGQAFILLTVAEKEGITHSEIAARLKISPAAASKVIRRLEDKNFLQRTPDQADERLSRVILREDGRAVIQTIHHTFRKVEEKMLTGFSSEEKKLLRDLLSRIHTNLQ